MRHMTLDQLRAAHASGGITSATLVADGSDFLITVETQSGQSGQLILTRRPEPRRFPDAGKAIALLKEIGILVGRFDTTAWTPGEGEKKKRPDSSRHMRDVHAAAGYVASLSKAVDEAEADPRPDIAHDTVMERLEAELAAIDKGRSPQ